MGFRLNIAKEPPNKDNNNFYIFNEDFMILEGGAWKENIFDLLRVNCEEVNIKKDKCILYPNCIFCDCSDSTWYKIKIQYLKDKNTILKDNVNLVCSFLLNPENIDDESWKNKAMCAYEYIIRHPHRDYVWINIS